jgi:hypothetical protein
MYGEVREGGDEGGKEWVEDASRRQLGAVLTKLSPRSELSPAAALSKSSTYPASGWGR